jgi:hypothetical protein
VIDLAHGFCQGASNGPSAMQSLRDCFSVYSSLDAPFLNGEIAAVMLEAPIAFLVSVLLYTCRPSAVSRLVSFGAVDSINGVAPRGLFTHIGKERLETVTPTFTNSNASTAVPSVVRRVGVEASVFQVDPRPVRGGIGHAVPFLAFGCLLSLIAAATNGVSAAEVGGSHGLSRSAFTYTQPLLASGIFQSGKAAEFLAAYIDNSVMGRNHD